MEMIIIVFVFSRHMYCDCVMFQNNNIDATQGKEVLKYLSFVSFSDIWLIETSFTLCHWQNIKAEYTPFLFLNRIP